VQPSPKSFSRPRRSAALGLVFFLASTCASFLLGFLLAAARADAVPTQLHFEQMSIEEGLPHQTVRSILQDRHGFMWFATQGGVVRFDGYRATVFRHDREDPNSIAANRVQKIVEDRQGTLWLATSEGGLGRFDAENESFRAYRHDGEDPNSIANDRVWDVFQDRGGRMWVATSSGLSLFDPVAETFTNGMLGPGFEGAAHVILEGSSDDLWIGTWDQGLVRFDPAGGSIDSYRNDPSDSRSLPGDEVFALHRDRAGSLWVGTGGGLAVFDPLKESFRVFQNDPTEPSSLANDLVQSIFEDRSGNFWAGTNRGLSLLHRGTGRFNNFHHDPSQPHSLPNDNIAAMFQDRTGILWFGTRSGGIARVDPRTWQFANFYGGSDPLRSPPGEVNALYEDRQGTLWVGTSQGLVHFDFRSETFSAPRTAPGPHRDVVGIAAEESGNVWVGSFRGELELWEPSEGGFRALPLNQNKLPRYIGTLCSDQAGVVWIAQQSLVKVEPGPRLKRYAHRPGDSTTLAPSALKSLAGGSDGSLWIGYSNRGLGRLRAGDEHFEHFRLYAETEGQPSVISIYEDEKAQVWVGTNAGLFRLLPNGDRPEVRSFTVRQGLASDLIAAILPDSKGRLWLSTSAGITNFDPHTETVVNFGPADGTLFGGYNKGAAVLLSDGRMVFGGPGGLTVFHPEEIRRDPSPPPLVLTDLRLRNQSVPLGLDESGLLDRPIHLTEEIVLGPGDDVVTFEFAALHFANVEANRYAYQLEGFDRDWILTDADQRVATYTDLPPGEFSLRVRAGNPDGVWNEEGITLRVKVLPPRWRTWWAYMLYALAFGGLIFGLVFANRRLEALVTARTAQVRRQARRIQQEHDAKTRFIANVSHEFRTPLTLAIGPLEDLLNDKDSQLSSEGRNNLDMALRNSRCMMGLVGQVLDIGRLETGQLRLRLAESDFGAAVRRETARFSTEARRHGVTLETELPDEPVPLVFDADPMDKVISNLLSNAIKFTAEKGSILVRLEEREREVVLEVGDTGQGIVEDDLPRVFERYFQGSRTVAAQPGTGIGLAIVKEIVELHGGRVEVWSRSGVGSVFTVKLLRGRDHVHSVDLHLEDADPSENTTHENTTHENTTMSPFESPAEDPSRQIEDDERTAVLIVDDNPELRTFLAVRLSASYRVLQAGDGEEALKIARQELPDLIVCDVMMPGLDGFAMTRELRQDPEISFIPVLLLTAKATKQDTIEGLQSGADDYLAKPFDAAELAARIAGLLASGRRIGEHLRCRQEIASSRPQTFEQRVRRTIVENLHDGTFTVQDLASALALDRTGLFRKVRQSFGKAPSELIRQLRLERAAELLGAQEGNVTEVCNAVGFPSLSYFGKRFRERYGVPPSRFGPGHRVPAQP